MIAKPGLLPKPTNLVNLEVHPIERLLEKNEESIKINDYVVLAIGTSTVIGQAIKSSGKNSFEFALRSYCVIEKNQKVAISKREKNGWRLRAYGISK